jgi:hypothetical protein
MTLDEAVAAVLNGEKRGEADDAIVAAGMEGARKLVDALNRSPLGEAAMRPDGSYNRTRFERVIDVLLRIDWPESADAMGGYLRSPRDGVRQRVTELLVGRGDERALELAARVLDEGKDEPAARGTIEAVHRALQTGRATASFRAGLFDRVAKDLTSDGLESLRYPYATSPAKMLLALDRQRAEKLLTTPPTLAADNPKLSGVLDAIEEARLRIDPATLRAMLPKMDSEHAVRAALRYLARAEGRGADDLLRAHLRHGDLGVRTEAFGLLMAAKGIDLFKLTTMQNFRKTLRQLHAVHQLLGVNSGDGLEAARHYLSKRQWKDAIDLLRRAGASETAGGLERLLRMDPEDMDEVAVEAVEETLFSDPERVHEKLFALVEAERI